MSKKDITFNFNGELQATGIGFEGGAAKIIVTVNGVSDSTKPTLSFDIDGKEGTTGLKIFERFEKMSFMQTRSHLSSQLGLKLGSQNQPRTLLKYFLATSRILQRERPLSDNKPQAYPTAPWGNPSINPSTDGPSPHTSMATQSALLLPRHAGSWEIWDFASPGKRPQMPLWIQDLLLTSHDLFPCLFAYLLLIPGRNREEDKDRALS